MFWFCPCCLEFLQGTCSLNDHSKSNLVSEIRNHSVVEMLYSKTEISSNVRFLSNDASHFYLPSRWNVEIRDYPLPVFNLLKSIRVVLQIFSQNVVVLLFPLRFYAPIGHKSLHCNHLHLRASWNFGLTLEMMCMMDRKVLGECQ